MSERLSDIDHLRLRVVDLAEALSQERHAHRVRDREQVVADLTARYSLGPADRIDIDTGAITRAAKPDKETVDQPAG